MRSIFTGLLFTFLLGCGGDSAPSGDGDGGDSSAQFVGTWSQSGTIVATCPTSPIPVDPRAITGDFVCTAADADEIECSSEEPACSWQFTVSGNTASIKPGQSCTVTLSGVAARLSPRIWTMNMATDGQTATETGSGDANATVPVLGSVACTFTISGSMTRSP